MELEDIWKIEYAGVIFMSTHRAADTRSSALNHMRERGARANCGDALNMESLRYPISNFCPLAAMIFTPPLRVLSAKFSPLSHESYEYLSHPILKRCLKLIRTIILPQSSRHTLGEMPIIQRLIFFHICGHT